jgi:hypothetical protein
MQDEERTKEKRKVRGYYIAWGKPCCDEEVQPMAEEASVEGMVASVGCW